MLEIEIKLKVDKEKVSKILPDETCPVSRVFEDDILYDFNDFRLTKNGYLLRLRSRFPVDASENIDADNGEFVLTWKGPAEKEKTYKKREELEFDFKEKSAAERFVSSLGLTRIWRYQKYRNIYKTEGLVITLDSTPMGVFMELEGEPEFIDKYAAISGFSRDDYITGTYYDLWQEYRKTNRDAPEVMVFDAMKDGE